MEDEDAVRALYDGVTWMDMDDVLAKCRELPPWEAERYFGNRWVSSPTRFLPARAWDAAAHPGRVVAAGEEVVLGFDGSYSGDSTAIVGCTRDEHLFVVAVWEKPSWAGDAWRVDIAEVEERIRRASKDYNVRAVACDPHLWARSLQALAEEGLPMVEWPSRTVARMVSATKSFYDAVTMGGLSHDGDALLADHVSNAVVKEDSAGVRLTKAHSSSGKHIDLLIAAVMAHDTVLSTPPKKHSVYETRGLIVI
jgi:phage terminase large subunit-like protein